MNKESKASLIINTLEKLYPLPKIPLDHRNDYTLLIAVLLSAQTTDKSVNSVSKHLFDKASDPISMVNLGEISIYNIIRRLGLSKTKSRNIYNLSRILINKYQMKVPNNFIDLESLPGVGHKTASVVMAQAFNIPTFPVDTHIHRLAQRWGITDGRNVKQTEIDLKAIFPKSLWNKLHLQIIFYGREYCTARKCDGTICQLCRSLYPKRTKPVICLKP